MKNKKRCWAAALFLAVAAAVWCNFSPEQETWIVDQPRLPDAFRGYRITLVTDLHGGRFGTNSQTLLQTVAAARPDCIAISGDLVDEYSDLSMLEPLLNGLTAIAPTCYVTGNHEWSRDDTETLLTRIGNCGVTVLRNDYLLLERQGQQLVLAGAEDPNAYADMEGPADFIARIRKEVPNDPYTVLLSHRNTALHHWSELEVDLVLSGHGHGGVVRLPFLGGIFGTDRTLFPDHVDGLFTQGRTIMAVSRGLGGTRLWNRPHLPTIVLGG